jgi:hypothetical protein
MLRKRNKKATPNLHGPSIFYHFLPMRLTKHTYSLLSLSLSLPLPLFLSGDSVTLSVMTELTEKCQPDIYKTFSYVFVLINTK